MTRFPKAARRLADAAAINSGNGADINEAVDHPTPLVVASGGLAVDMNVSFVSARVTAP